MSATAGPDADRASSSGQLGALGSRSSDGGKFAEGVGPEEVTVYSQAQEGASSGLKAVSSLINSAGSGVYQFSPVLALNFHNTVCNVIMSAQD